MDLFANLLNKLTDCNTPLLLLGDLNLDLLKYSQNRQVTDYVDLLFSFGFLQLIMRPTRLSSNSATLIDHILTSNSDITESAVLISDISDHFPIFCFSKSSTYKTHSIIKARNFSDENIDQFKLQLQNINWEFLTILQNAQTAYNEFSDTFFTLFDLYFPLITKKVNRNLNRINPWFTRGLLVSRQQKNILYKEMLNNPFDPYVSSYKNYRNLYNKIVRASKKLFFESEILKNQSDSRKTWQILRKAINTSKKPVLLSQI